MVTINGIKANDTLQVKQKETKPTLNQILDTMENNFQSINSAKSFNSSNNNLDTKNIKNSTIFNADNYNNQSNKQNTNQGIFENLLNSFNQDNNTTATANGILPNTDNNGLIMSVLPMLLNNTGKNGFKNCQDVILKEMLKNSNNPRLTQLVQLLPKLFNNKNQSFAEPMTKTQKEEPKIDSFTKTDEYID